MSLSSTLELLDDILDDLTVATTMILVTSIIHAIGLDRIMALVSGRIHLSAGRRFKHHFYKIVLAVTTILGIFFLITIHIWLWAFMYRFLDIQELPKFEDAVYFSTVTFTTLGYGDVVLKDDWRVLSGIEAANGIILLGWSTAFVFEIMSLLYPRQSRER